MNSTIELSGYQIVFGPVKTTLHSFLLQSSYSVICILVDHNTIDHCLPLVNDLIPEAHIICINPGEKFKSLASCELIWSEMAKAKADRHSLLINLGGGVIGDMGGFAASCYMRGIDFIQIPTTLLSQVDASVGGKLAIDFIGFKNFIGLFENPDAVLIDPEFLNTLPQRELRSGFSEMIKHGLIKDKAAWNRFHSIEKWEDLEWGKEINVSVLVKKEIVEKDPRESGLRKILNFGHTVGHAIESIALTSEQPLLHGEAIAIGMMVETMLSHELSLLQRDQADRVLSYIRKVFKDLDLSILFNKEDILRLIKSDKKNRAGKVLFSLLSDVGECTFDIPASNEQIEKSLRLTYDQLSGR